MSVQNKSDLVRYSRAGDDFHYTWAARKCLSLLDPSGSLYTISIEAFSKTETDKTAEEIADVALYYSDEEEPRAPQKIEYVQLKHSLKQLDKPFTLSGLKKTVNGWYRKYLAVMNGKQFPATTELSFCFLSNRPVNESIKKLFIAAADDGLSITSNGNRRTLRSWFPETSTPEELKSFFRLVTIKDDEKDYLDQRSFLHSEVNDVIPGVKTSAATELWSLVQSKALPNERTNPDITKYDVLRVLNCTKNGLFPAPSLIGSSSRLFEREQEREILAMLLAHESGKPVIIHAEGGVGKTALSKRLSETVPEPHLCVLFDCFANGAWRSASQGRHTHEKALIQISNEIASHSLCLPMLASPAARASDYLTDFKSRLEQASASLRRRSKGAKIILIIDAADNAQMAAAERGEGNSFAKDLIREDLPEGVVMVFTCRTHRLQDTLSPPHGYSDIPLRDFSLGETKAHLDQKFPDATERQLEDFHRLTSLNPRVQATVLAQADSLVDCFNILGVTPLTVEETIKSIFQTAMEKMKSDLTASDQRQLQRMCEALATLRPFVPIDLLSKLSDVPAGAIKSFATDIGRPIYVDSDHLQFFDEPSETWFRETYRPKGKRLKEIINALRAFSADSGYVASSLPQLMLEAGQYDELVQLVLSDRELPENNSVERQLAKSDRLQFALKAAIRAGRLEDATKLSMLAGHEAAGSQRKKQIYSDNTDLVGRLLEKNELEELLVNVDFDTGWHGSQFCYQACLLSVNSATKVEARNRLRSAKQWLQNWARTSPQDRKRIGPEDIAILSCAALYSDSADRFVRELDAWLPKTFVFNAATIAISKVIDAGEFDVLEKIEKAANGVLSIEFALLFCMSRINRAPSKSTTLRCLRALKKYPRIIKSISEEGGLAENVDDILCAVFSAALKQKVCRADELKEIVAAHQPHPNSYDFYGYGEEDKFEKLRLIALNAYLLNREIEIDELAPDRIKKLISSTKKQIDEDIEKFRNWFGSLIPWHLLWVRVLAGEVTSLSLSSEIHDCEEWAKKASGRQHYQYRHEHFVFQDIVRLRYDIVLLCGGADAQFDAATLWLEKQSKKLYLPALLRITRLCAVSVELQRQAFVFADKAREVVESDDSSSAEEKLESYISIARAICPLGKLEALAYLNLGLTAAEGIGEENMDRWHAVTVLAECAINLDAPSAQLAFEFSKSGEIIYKFLAREKYFSWDHTVETLANLSPASSIAVTSRWKDRRFGWQNEILPTLLKRLVERGSVPPETAMAFIGFDYLWNYSNSLAAVLETKLTRSQKQTIASRVIKYALLRDCSLKELRSLQKACVVLSLESEELKKRIEVTELEADEIERERTDFGGLSPEKNVTSFDWEELFTHPISNSADAIADLVEQFRRLSADHHLSVADLAEQYFSKVSAGAEGEAIAAFIGTSNISFYDFGAILKRIPPHWKNRAHLRDWVRTAASTFISRHYYEVSSSRWFQAVPFDLLEELSGLSKLDVYRITVEASGQAREIDHSGQLFTLSGLLAKQLKAEEAARALKFATEKLEELAPVSVIDGVWRDSLSPQNEDCETALAGYLWLSLGSAYVRERWQAAHTICNLTEFGQTSVVVKLLEFTAEQAPYQFFDHRLPFYRYSAVLWMMMAFRRIVGLSMELPQEAVEFVQEQAASENHHLLIRELAAEILIGFHKLGALSLLDSELDRVKNINISKKIVYLKSYERDGRRKINETDGVADEKKFHFDFEFSDQQFSSLGSIFDMSAKEVEEYCLQSKHHFLSDSSSGRWADDPRQMHGIYDPREDFDYRSTSPRVENYNFYQTFHSTMLAAGELIDSRVRFQAPDEDIDEFEYWKREFKPTRDDGLWLFDMRDPTPPELCSWAKGRDADEYWPTYLSKSRMLELISVKDDFQYVWGSWQNASGERREDISVYSALVTPDKARSLMNALQCDPPSVFYRLPDADVDSELNARGFSLKGWIETGYSDKHIDTRDPWSGEISYPTNKPADWFTEYFGLERSEDGRCWTSKHVDQKEPIVKIRNWGNKSQDGSDDSPPYGERISIRTSALQRYLTDLSLDLIVQVKIRRSYQYKSYLNQKYGRSDADPYMLFGVHRADGTFFTI